VVCLIVVFLQQCASGWWVFGLGGLSVVPLVCVQGVCGFDVCAGLWCQLCFGQGVCWCLDLAWLVVRWEFATCTFFGVFFGPLWTVSFGFVLLLPVGSMCSCL
jgi:hypothetical protein